MAKILTGPLAAGLSGKLGPVVFHQTKFGQVVQSKAKPRTYTTPAALATKFAFKVAAQGVGRLGQFELRRWSRVYDGIGKFGPAQVIRTASSVLRAGEFLPWPATGNPASELALGTPTTVAGQLRIPYTYPGADAIEAFAHVFTYNADGLVRLVRMLDILGDNILRTPPTFAGFPCAVIVFGAIPAGIDPNGYWEKLTQPQGFLFLVAP